MPLRLEIKKELSARSDRVKSVDIYPAEHPWVLSALYNGNVYIWDYSTNTLVKSFEMCEVPVRCAKFIVRKQWIIAGTDDMHLRVYNYNTSEKVKAWEAHTDYIRYVEIHPNRPYIISSSDDMSIKMWDWEKDFECIQLFEGHVHYVMMIKVNPRDTNTFASASLDRSIKVWGLTAGTAHFSLEGTGAHERGVNCIDYYPGGDKPYLLSGADDRTVKIWDYQTKSCLQTLEGHSHNVSSVCFHPRLPLIISASEDGTVRLWHSTTYRPESTLNYGLERAWCLAPTKDANKLAIGYDEGTVVLKLGNEKPVASLDTNTGKLVWAHNHDIQAASLKGLGKDGDLTDGEKLPLAARDMGACEVYPQTLLHNCNGAYIVVLGDGEYIIYTSQALRNKVFGFALDFVWSSQGTGDFAVKESFSRVKTFKNFKEHKQIHLPITSADALFAGVCLGVKGGDSIVFFDWEDGEFIRKIDVSPEFIFWNEAGDALVLACADSYYVLRYNREVVAAALAAGNINPEEGVDGSFELETTINDRVRTGQWVGDCFLYTNSSGKLNYFVGGEVMTLCHLTHPMYLLGFVPKEDRVFLIDKAYNVVSYKVLLSVLNYQTAVVRKDFVTANSILPSIPRSEHGAVARFLESQGYKEEALAVSTDPDHRFELALDLRKMDVAHAVLEGLGNKDEDSTDYQSKWRRLGDLSLANGDVALAKSCASRSGDLSGLLLLHSSAGDVEGMRALALQAKDAGRSNVAFLALFVTGQVEECIQLLIDTGRIPEAAFMARTYMPSMISSVLELWKADLKQINEKAAEALADPVKYPNLFPDLEWALQVETIFQKGRSTYVPSSTYLTARTESEQDHVSILKAQAQAKALAEAPAVVEPVVEEIQHNESKTASAVAPEGEEEEEECFTPPAGPTAAELEIEARARKVAEEEELSIALAQKAKIESENAATQKKDHDIKVAKEAADRAEQESIREDKKQKEIEAGRAAEVEARRKADDAAAAAAALAAKKAQDDKVAAEVAQRVEAEKVAKMEAEKQTKAKAEAERVAKVEAEKAAAAAKEAARLKAEAEAEASRKAAAAAAEVERQRAAAAAAVVEEEELDLDAEMDAELEMIDAAEAHGEDEDEDLDALLAEDEVVDRGAAVPAVKQDDEVSLEDAGDEEDW